VANQASQWELSSRSIPPVSMPFAPIVEALSTAQRPKIGYAPTAASDGARLGQNLGVALGEGRGGGLVEVVDVLTKRV
jgi:hypothetical protein